MNETNNTQVSVTEVKYPDSMEFGTPSKGGVWKCYFNASNMEESKVRLENALALFTDTMLKDSSIRSEK